MIISRASQPSRVPKILGADVELGNFVEGAIGLNGSGRVASRLLLNAITGVPARRSSVGSEWTGNATVPMREWENGSADDGGTTSTSLQDWGRRFLPSNGGCAYIDLDHLELALPETFSAFDHVAYWRAMLHLARGATKQASRTLPEGFGIGVLANCSDGHGHSYGAHMNVLLTRTAWDNLTRRPHYLAFLSAFQVSSIVFTGGGKVGSENDRPWADYQLSQRADFIETLLGEQTTFSRPLVNTRNEPLCGTAPGHRSAIELARLHVIFFDATLCQAATLLRAGTMQMIVAMIEAECVSADLALDDPVDTLHRWSRSVDLDARARLVSGSDVTAVELQMRFLEDARRFHASHGFDGIVPRAANLLDLWEDTLAKLRDRDFPSLSRRLDWVLKRQVLERVVANRPDLSWTSPEIRHLDQMFASLDTQEGLFWSLERSGLVDHIVSAADVRRAVHEPPDDTRAWTRAHLLRRCGPHIESVDWDVINFRLDHRPYPWPARRTVTLPCPFKATSTEHAALFARARSIDEVVSGLESGNDEKVAHHALTNPRT